MMSDEESDEDRAGDINDEQHRVAPLKPYKLHSFMDKYPISSFCIALFCFAICGVLVVVLGQSGDLITMSNEVPFYIRGNAAEDRKDALLAAELDATYEPQGGDAKTREQSITADVELQLLYIIGDGNKAGLMQEKYLSMMDELESALSAFESYDSKCKRVYNNDGYKCTRRQTVTQFFDPQYFIGAVDRSYDAWASTRNYDDFLQPSLVINDTAEVAHKDYTSTNIDAITSYWSGYGAAGGTYQNVSLPLKFYYSSPKQGGDSGQLLNNSLANVFKSITDGTFGATPVSTRVKASISKFYFGLPLDGYDSHVDDLVDQEDEIGEWCYDNLDGILSDYEEKFSDVGITLRWDCATMRDYAITDLIASDATLLLLTFVSVYLIMMFNLNSFFLGSLGMCMIFLNFLPSLLLYRYISQLSYFGTLNLLSMFIILAIGADDIFVIFDTWAQIRIKYPTESCAQRLTFTINHAAKVMATTSLSTIFSFVGNTTSAFPAVYTFGWFSAWLVFVNYFAVVLFFPTVLTVHDKYFYTPNLKRPWCCFKTCSAANRKYDADQNETNKCYNTKSPAAVKETERAIDNWFENVYFSKFVYRFKYIILAIFGAILLTFAYFATQLEADPNAPQLFPDGNNYEEYRGDLSDNFATENAWQVTNFVTFGLKGIDRSGTDETDADDIGDPVYDELISFSLANEQEYIAQMCDDLICGFSEGYDCRYNNVWQDLHVMDATVVFGADASHIHVLKCFMTEFREWVTSNAAAKLSSEDIAALSAQNALDGAIFADCVFDGSFPVAGEQCFALLFVFVWMNEDLPTSNPDYSAGTTNYDYWKQYTMGSTNDDATDSMIEGFNAEGKLRFIKISILLDLYLDTEYKDGIEAWDSWDEYLTNWREDVAGTVSVDKYGNEFVATPDSLAASSFTDDGTSFAYYYNQEQIIKEAISGIFTSLLLAYIVLIFATNNFIISLMCVFVIFCIVICVVGFTVLMGWKLGVIEAVIFVLVVGMSVDYVVHLSEAYLHAGHDFFKSSERAKAMLGIVGGSIIAGALSTIIGVMWLCFAQIGLFYKFGVTLLFLIATSVSFSLLGYAAFISIFGPDGDRGNVWKNVVSCYNCRCCKGQGNDDEEENRVEMVA